MASGNPFRASQAFSQSASTPVPQTSFINTDSSARGDSDYVLEDKAAPPPKTKKSVRIISPTTTIPPHPAFDDEDATLNELIAQRSSQGQPASPPPPVVPSGFANSTVTAREANAQMLGREVMATPEILPSSRPYFDKHQAALSPSNVPANPFSRTLASLEPQEKETGEERTRAQRPGPGLHRASLDVESFKNLLLTGKATPRPSGPAQNTNASNPVSGAHFESSSSTDTSSISRQSIFEHPQELHAESPRTSVDMADSDEDESMGLVSEVKKGKKKPPPAPKHRHGKLVVQRQPQTVSFDNFAASTSTPPPAIRRTDSSDMNKPLPPTPVVALQSLHISTQDTTPFQSPPIPARRSEPSTPSEGATRQKRAPPPVPLARRQSQLKTTTHGNRSRSSSNLTMNSQHSADALTSPVPHNQDPISSAKSPPPPPPSRHGARLANLSNSSANSSSTELPQRSSSVRTARSIPDPPSSRRSTMDSETPSSPTPGVNRTSSLSSNRNVSGGSTGSQMPPPPPPPPRRQRASLDQQRPYIPPSSSSPTESRRTSTEYNRRTSTENRRTSVASESSLRREYAPVEGERGNEVAVYSPNEEREMRLGVVEGEGAKLTESRSGSGGNILDDMERFQREIDELVQRTRQPG